VESIDAHTRPLVLACFDGLKKLSVELITPDEPESIAGIVAFRHPEADRLHRTLWSHDVHIMSHAGRLRVAIHGYNTMDDVQKLLEILEQALKEV